MYCTILPLRWRYNGRDGVSNHQPHDCLLNRLFRRRSKNTSKLCVTGLCTENSPGTGEFSAQMASKAENVSISWRHHHNWFFTWPNSCFVEKGMSSWCPFMELLSWCPISLSQVTATLLEIGLVQISTTGVRFSDELQKLGYMTGYQARRLVTCPIVFQMIIIRYVTS